jgi:hypothetical protein
MLWHRTTTEANRFPLSLITNKNTFVLNTAEPSEKGDKKEKEKKPL